MHQHQLSFLLKSTVNDRKGLPWWLSGKESACQYRRHGFNPCSGKIPHALEKEMTTHSSILVWEIPGTEEPGKLQSVPRVTEVLDTT